VLLLLAGQLVVECVQELGSFNQAAGEGCFDLVYVVLWDSHRLEHCSDGGWDSSCGNVHLVVDAFVLIVWVCWEGACETERLLVLPCWAHLGNLAVDYALYQGIARLVADFRHEGAVAHHVLDRGRGRGCWGLCWAEAAVR
jgi:hypothetical protein